MRRFLSAPGAHIACIAYIPLHSLHSSYCDVKGSKISQSTHSLHSPIPLIRLTLCVHADTRSYVEIARNIYVNKCIHNVRALTFALL